MRWRRRRAGERGAPKSRGQTVMDEVLQDLDVLERCEHLARRACMRYWIALDPDRLVCEFCWGAAQVLASSASLRCEFCGWPVTDPEGADAVVVARLAPDLAVHFWLCGACADADIALRDDQ
jgi:hypothetical protein